MSTFQSLCDLIVAETNRYARLRKKGNWADVDREEMWTFMGINILMGIHRLPRISNYWSRDSLLGIPALKRYMSRNRFWEIWTHLHIVDNSRLSPRWASRSGAVAAPVVDTSVHFRYMRVSPRIHPQESRYQRKEKPRG